MSDTLTFYRTELASLAAKAKEEKSGNEIAWQVKKVYHYIIYLAKIGYTEVFIPYAPKFSDDYDDVRYQVENDNLYEFIMCLKILFPDIEIRHQKYEPNWGFETREGIWFKWDENSE